MCVFFTESLCKEGSFEKPMKCDFSFEHQNNAYAEHSFLPFITPMIYLKSVLSPVRPFAHGFCDKQNLESDSATQCA